jgi:ArsR family transcriptional regulator
MSRRQTKTDIDVGGSDVASVPDVEQLVLVAKALADANRLRMLKAMAAGRTCCALAPAPSKSLRGEGEPDGICVCEFQEQFGLGQSKVSYHLHVLKDAGLVREEARGKWTFYSPERRNLSDALEALHDWLAP